MTLKVEAGTKRSFTCVGILQQFTQTEAQPDCSSTRHRSTCMQSSTPESTVNMLSSRKCLIRCMVATGELGILQAGQLQIQMQQPYLHGGTRYNSAIWTFFCCHL